jgi:hydrogenase nickel incorporation protein HypB
MSLRSVRPCWIRSRRSRRSVALLSVPEGDDKPAKYPVMFRKADLVLITKTDLAPYIGEFDIGRAEAALRDLASTVPVMALSSRNGGGLTLWLDWLRAQVAVVRRHHHPNTDHHHDHGPALAG